MTYVGECYKVLRSSLDGKNLEVVLLEFGIRLHRVIYDHIQQFSINEMGVCMCVGVWVCGVCGYVVGVGGWVNGYVVGVWGCLFCVCMSECVCVLCGVCWEEGCSFACRAC